MTRQRIFFSLFVAMSLLVAQNVQAQTTIQFLDGVTGLTAPNATVTPTAPTYTDTTDYSNTGIDIGNDGFIFFNWDAPAPTSGVHPAADTVSQNVNNELPAWLGLDFDPNSANYSFGNDPGVETFAKGGISTWDTLTPPEGFAGSGAGLSGALVDPAADNNSNNTISGLGVLAGAPSSFWLHVVTDNTAGDHDPAGRLRARESADGASSRLNSIPALNGTADVYSFLYTDVVPGDILKFQLNSGVAGEDASIAGFMIDVVPEPSSAALLVLGALGLIGRRRR